MSNAIVNPSFYVFVSCLGRKRTVFFFAHVTIMVLLAIFYGCLFDGLLTSILSNLDQVTLWFKGTVCTDYFPFFHILQALNMMVVNFIMQHA